MKVTKVLPVLLLSLILICSFSCKKNISGGTYLETRIIGQSEIFSGAPASLRVIAFDARGMKPLKGAEITATLTANENQKTVELFKQSSDEFGSIAFNYNVPSDIKGNGSIEINVKAPEGERKDIVPVIIKEKEPKTNLSTDKPLYQPGQTVYIKAMSLLLPTLEPAGKKKVTLEIMDPKGNKVLKEEKETSDYGIASTDFVLAREINMGEYTIKISGDCGTAEKKFLVKKYVLPKFKPVMEAEKQFYQAGEKIEGHVSAKYFFGKPTTGAKVIINVMAYDGTFKKVSTIKGTTDKEGIYKFSYDIQKNFSGSVYEQNKAYIQLEANVIDPAEHKEVVTHNYPLTKDPITVQVMPEGGRLVANLENNMYLLTSNPDGSPVECNLMVKFSDGKEPRQLSTDSNGYAVLPCTPKAGEHLSLTVTAQDKKGNKAEKSVKFVAEAKEESIIIRSDKTLYGNGDVAKIKLLSTQKEGSAYLDIIRAGKTIFTQSVDIKGGQGNIHFDVPSGVFGLVSLNGYFVSPYTGIVQDNRSVYIAPMDLTISGKLDKASYRPGEEAKISFEVTDKKGAPVPSAIGVDIVDESLFAMFERRPGMEKIQYLINPQYLTSPYVLKGLNMGDFILNAQEPSSDTGAKVLIAQAPQISPYTVNQDSYREKIQKILGDLQTAGSACQSFYGNNKQYANSINDLVKAGFMQATKDPWGQDYIIKPPQSENKSTSPYWNETMANVICIGADGKEGTPDDLDYRDFVIAMGSVPRRDVIYYEDEVKGGQIALETNEARIATAEQKMDKGMDYSAKDKALAPPAPATATQASLDGGVEPVRVREYFPETLFSNPQLITDDKGKAELNIPLADSITTWRMSTVANSQKGELGSYSSGVKVFQDFFIDLNLPVKLTAGDEVSVPVSIYNYLPSTQKVQLKMEKGDWFEIIGQDIIEAAVPKEDVKSASFRIKVKDVGIHKFTVNAKGSSMGDAITKEIEVEPYGKKYVLYKGDMITGKGGSTTLTIPGNAVSGGSNILLTVYPRPFSQIVEGLDSVFSTPSGCFEQTSSTTYPNVLALDYLRKTKQSSPEIERKANAYINQGYQMLLGYEIQGGGFQVWGEAPATKVLTAYGIMEFTDMSEVYQVDTAVIERAKKWLLSVREPDGSWTPDAQFAHAEQWGTIQSNNIPSTAYITWALAEAKCKDELSDSIAYLKKNLGQIDNPYILALCANAFLTVNPSDSEGLELLKKLDGTKKSEEGVVYWESNSLYSSGTPAQIETTALIIYGMLKAGVYPDTTTKGLNFIVRSKDQYGLWQSTQATIFAMRALMLSQTGVKSDQLNITADILINGQKADSFKVDEKNQDVFQQFDLKKYVKTGDNKIEIAMTGEGTIAYRVAGIYYLPWSGEKAAGKELSINLAYDKTEVKTSDYITCKVDVKNLRNSYAPMVMIEAGIPPGFDVMTEDLEKMVEKRTISKYETFKGKVVLYLNGLDKGKSFSGSYRLLARIPLKAKTLPGITYLYYNPEINSVCAPVTFEVL